MKNPFKTTVCAACAAALSAAVFASGCFIRDLTRPSSYDWALSLVQSNYLYYDDLDLSGLRDGDMEGLVSMLDDYSLYYSPEAYAQLTAENAGNRTGVGVQSQRLADGRYLIVRVLGNSPAYASGIKAGEYIEGGEFNGVYYDFSANADMSQLVSDLPNGENFTLKTDRGEYVIAKADYTSTYTRMCTSSGAWTFSSDGNDVELVEEDGGAMDFLPEGYAYISLSQFYGSVAKEFYYLVEKFKAEGCTTLVLDLRNNGGGFVTAMQDIAGCFAEGIAQTARFRGGAEEYNYCSEVEERYKLPNDVKIYALANIGTASASEALLGVLISSGRLRYGDVFVSDFSQNYLDYLESSGGKAENRRTYGKGIMQYTFARQFNSGKTEGMRLTVAQVYWANGRTIHGTGIGTDDGCRSVPAEWCVTYGDEELRAAVQLMQGD